MNANENPGDEEISEDYEVDEDSDYSEDDFESIGAPIGEDNGVNEDASLQSKRDLENMFNEAQQSPMHSDFGYFADATPADANMIKVQIDCQQLLEEISHFLRGDKKIPIKGKLMWVEQKDESLKTLNDYGYAKCMELLHKYVNPNTILSQYSEMRLYVILSTLGEEMSEMILKNYKAMGLDSKEKESQYGLLVLTTLHMIESAYRRSIGGKTFEEINQSRLGGDYRMSGGRMPAPIAPKKSFIQRLAGL